MWYIIMYNAWYFLHCFHISALMPSIPMLFSPFCNIARITSSLLCQLNICLVEVIIAIRGKIINLTSPLLSSPKSVLHLQILFPLSRNSQVFLATSFFPDFVFAEHNHHPDAIQNHHVFRSIHHH